MQKFFSNVVDKVGNIQAGVSVTVADAATGALATLYSNNEGSVKANPVVTDSNGYFDFYIANGRYTMTFSGPRIPTYTISDVVIEDMVEAVKSLRDFGAVGGGAVDDTAALNRAFDWLRDYPVTDPPLMRPLRLVGHGNIYRCTGPVDATGINLGRTWEVDGVNIVSEAVAKTAIDFTGIRYAHIRNLRVWGLQGSQPHTGILLARNAGTCSDNKFDNCQTDGYFTTSGFTEYAAEINQFNHCHFWNRRVPDGAGEAWAAILQGTDFKPMVSDFQTLSTGRQSFTVNQFNQCMFQKPFGIVGPTMFIQDLASTSFRGCYVTNGGDTAIVWRLTNGFTPYYIVLDFQQETTGTDRFIQFTSDAAAAREIRALDCTFGNSFCDQEIFKSDTLTSLLLNDIKIRLPRLSNGVALANGVFNPATAALTTIRKGDITVPAMTDFGSPAAFAGITAEVTSMDGSYAVFSPHQVVLAQAAPGTVHTGTLVDTVLATIPMPAGYMGKNGRFIVTSIWSFTNNANAKNVRVKFDGTLLNNQPATSSASGRYQTELSNKNAYNSQVGNSAGTDGLGNSGVVVVTTAIDTLLTKNITLGVNLTNVGDSVTLESYSVVLVRGE